ncbi:protein-tyrosine-phosphatase [Weeksellaceae bacterium KMM 9713]|uniref:Protein-tyrosine-phosphatase n=1 Tax=Profundicola chukchiensis TaxID=2961959 RepID=A0A9X4RXH6_9FLAO|nr:protein-tyrosine-phosphatase [Profundicola chukchiensis]MDG4946439.1 protein-tyrosine-phosphatase [Profundicola chukchiensis]
MKGHDNKLFPKLEAFIQQLNPEDISTERKEILQTLIDYIQSKVNQNQVVNLNFICTHNSRRSHLSQIWAQCLAFYFGFNQVRCYSGGTETTALFPMVIKTLENAGFEIETIAQTENPIYSIKYTPNEHPIIGFSKKLDDVFNPSSEFAAIMTCDSANESCPIVNGAEIRIPITYQDPKAFDQTPQQSEKYQERSGQIATEMFYVFSQIKK